MKVDGKAATEDMVPSPKASLLAPSVVADVTCRLCGLSPTSLILTDAVHKGAGEGVSRRKVGKPAAE